MKKIVLIILMVVAVAAFLGYRQVKAKYQRVTTCLSDAKALAEDTCQAELSQLSKLGKGVNRYWNDPRLTDALDIYEQLTPLLPFSPYLLGTDDQDGTSVMVMLQNDYELRANGGFFGSYAVMEIKDGEMKTRFEDIYTPDGQVVWYVPPPEPIQEAFKMGGYKLRNSDWEPSYPQASQVTRWFLVKGKEIDPDIMMTLSLTAIQKLVEVVGEFEVAEYNIKLNKDNIYLFLQNETEVGFFPGSTQKKDVIGASGRALINRLKQLPLEKKLKVAKLVLSEVENQNMVINSKNKDFQEFLLAKNWGGELKPAVCVEPNCISDTYSLIEANMGANKANCCVSRQTEHLVSVKDGEIIHQVVTWFNNQSYLESPKPPEFYGGNYISYLRFYLPKEARDIKIETEPTFPLTLVDYAAAYQPEKGVGSLSIKESYGLTEVGFFHVTRAQSQSRVKISYKLKRVPGVYQLTILKQNGVRQSPQVIEVMGRKEVSELTNDYQLSTETD